MVPLRVNTRTAEWHAVTTYVAARRLELVEEAIDVAAPADKRLVAAARIAELDELMAAPTFAVEEERRGAEAAQRGQGVY